MNQREILVAAITTGKHVPSARFRVRQHIDLLRECGVVVKEYIPIVNKYASLPEWLNKQSPKYVRAFSLVVWQGTKLLTRVPGIIGSWKHHITWLQRNLLSGFYTFEGLIKKPIVFDVDDADWLIRPFGYSAHRTIARRADIVIAGNQYLADWFSSFASDVRIVPTAVDTVRFKPAVRKGDSFVIGWTGSSVNLRYLHAIERPLKLFLERFRDAQIHVVCDLPPRFATLPADRVRFIRWSAAIEAEAVRCMDVGLMPLSDDEWTRGKCSFKMLQYMACGIPVVVSPVGMNAEILNMGSIGFGATADDEWYESLVFLYMNRARAVEFGRQGRKVVEKYYSRRVVAAQLATIFKDLS